jgi:hypothetical protein
VFFRVFLRERIGVLLGLQKYNRGLHFVLSRDDQTD